MNNLENRYGRIQMTLAFYDHCLKSENGEKIKLIFSNFYPISGDYIGHNGTSALGYEFQGYSPMFRERHMTEPVVNYTIDLDTPNEIKFHELILTDENGMLMSVFDKLSNIKIEKEVAIKKQDYEMAANLRTEEKRLINLLDNKNSNL